jgi:hypothetical protein
MLIEKAKVIALYSSVEIIMILTGVQVSLLQLDIQKKMKL